MLKHRLAFVGMQGFGLLNLIKCSKFERNLFNTAVSADTAVIV